MEDAVKRNDIKAVELLLADPRVDPSADYNRAINLATENGHTKVVKLLLVDRYINITQYYLGNTGLFEPVLIKYFLKKYFIFLLFSWFS